MVIRLNALQIAQFWDVIKYALQQVERIGTVGSPEKLNLTFAALMADRAQCFIKYSEDMMIQGVMITETIENRYTKKRVMNVMCLYAYKFVDLKSWENTFDMLKKVALKEGCESITFQSNHPRILEMGNEIGFKKIHSTMEFQLGD